MSGRFGRFILLFFFGVVGCAQPKYERVDPAPRSDPAQTQNLSNCAVTFQELEYCLLWAWEKLPTSSEQGVLIFKVVRPSLLDGSAIPVDLESVIPNVVLWMPSMGHGSTPTKTVRVDTGSFRTSDVFFIMPGQWEIKFQFKSGDEVVDESIVPLSI